MGKNANEAVLREVDDMYLGEKAGGSLSLVLAIIGIVISAAGTGATASNIASQKYDCGVLWSVSAECSSSGEAC